MSWFARIASALFIFILTSCNNKQPQANGIILPKAKMQLVLWDMLQADAFTQNFIKIDSSKNAAVENAALQKKIFELHKIKREDFDASYNYYTTHPEEMRSILDSISSKGERDRSKLMQDRYGGGKPIIQQ
jgi:hypothetical protein